MTGRDEHTFLSLGREDPALCHVIEGVECAVRVDAIRPGPVFGVGRDTDAVGDGFQDAVEVPVGTEGEPERVLRVAASAQADVAQVVLSRRTDIPGHAAPSDMCAHLVSCRNLVGHAASGSRPCAGKTAIRVSRMLPSTASPGTCGSYGANVTSASSVLRVGATSPFRPVASARHSSGVSKAGSIGAPATSASKCVQT